MKKSIWSLNYMIRTAMLLALALVFQLGFRLFAQPVVGPLVNLVLIISVILVGTGSGIIIGCLTPIIAFMAGVMNLFPLVPFIMIANVLFVIAFGLVPKNILKFGDYIALVSASFIKYLFLTLSVNYLLGYFIPKVPQKIIETFSLPQFYTALIGGIGAIIVAKYVIRAEGSYLKKA